LLGQLIFEQSAACPSSFCLTDSLRRRFHLTLTSLGIIIRRSLDIFQSIRHSVRDQRKADLDVMEPILPPNQERRPPGCPAVYPQAFPTIPPAPFHLTDDLFSALHLRPLFTQYVGKPDEIVDESKVTGLTNVKVEGNPSRDGSASAGPSTPARTTFDEQPKPEIAKVKKREWIKPPRYIDSILGGLPGQ